MGLVQELAPAHDVLAHAQALAKEIADNAPLSLRAIKAGMRAAEGVPTHQAVQDVHEILGGLLHSDDATEGIAAFVEKRRPQFTAS
jgi:enoyl-CoA hydratase/carnithine racemase